MAELIAKSPCEGLLPLDLGQVQAREVVGQPIQQQTPRVTLRQRLLEYLAEHPNMTSRQFADELGFTIRNVHDRLNVMQKAGLVESKPITEWMSGGTVPVAWKLKRKR